MRKFPMIRAGAVLTLTAAMAATAAAQQDVREVRDARQVHRLVDRHVHEVVSALHESLADLRESMADLQRDLHRDLRLDLSLSRGDVAGLIASVARDLPRFSGDLVFDTETQNRFRAEQVSRETRTLTLGADGTLDLRNISGDIEVTTGTGNETTIEIVRTSRGEDEAAAKRGLEEVRVEITERNGRASVETRYPNTENRRSRYSVSSSYTVRTPAGTTVNVGSISGDIDVRGVQGGVTVDVISGDVTLTGARVRQAKTVSGDMVLTDVTAEAELDASTMSGDVRLRNVRTRRLTSSTINGDMTATGVEADNVALKTISGDVSFDGNFARTGRYDFQSHSGTVRVTVPADLGFELEASTFSGDLTLTGGLTLTDATRTRRALRGTVGGGGATINATTFSGDVIIGRR